VVPREEKWSCNVGKAPLIAFAVLHRDYLLLLVGILENYFEQFCNLGIAEKSLGFSGRLV
jgi:hypothetical protein